MRDEDVSSVPTLSSSKVSSIMIHSLWIPYWLDWVSLSYPAPPARRWLLRSLKSDCVSLSSPKPSSLLPTSWDRSVVVGCLARLMEFWLSTSEGNCSVKVKCVDDYRRQDCLIPLHCTTLRWIGIKPAYSIEPVVMDLVEGGRCVQSHHDHDSNPRRNGILPSCEFEIVTCLMTVNSKHHKTDSVVGEEKIG